MLLFLFLVLDRIFSTLIYAIVVVLLESEKAVHFSAQPLRLQVTHSKQSFHSHSVAPVQSALFSLLLNQVCVPFSAQQSPC